MTAISLTTGNQYPIADPPKADTHLLLAFDTEWIAITGNRHHVKKHFEAIRGKYHICGPMTYKKFVRDNVNPEIPATKYPATPCKKAH